MSLLSHTRFFFVLVFTYLVGFTASSAETSSFEMRFTENCGQSLNTVEFQKDVANTLIGLNIHAEEDDLQNIILGERQMEAVFQVIDQDQVAQRANGTVIVDGIATFIGLQNFLELRELQGSPAQAIGYDVQFNENLLHQVKANSGEAHLGIKPLFMLSTRSNGVGELRLSRQLLAGANRDIPSGRHQAIEWKTFYLLPKEVETIDDIQDIIEMILTDDNLNVRKEDGAYVFTAEIMINDKEVSLELKTSLRGRILSLSPLAKPLAEEFVEAKDLSPLDMIAMMATTTNLHFQTNFKVDRSILQNIKDENYENTVEVINYYSTHMERLGELALSSEKSALKAFLKKWEKLKGPNLRQKRLDLMKSSLARFIQTLGNQSRIAQQIAVGGNVQGLIDRYILLGF